MIARIRRAARWEDLLLVAWLILVEPLLAPAESAPRDTPDLFNGLFGLAGLAGLAACIGARSAPGVVTGLVAGNEIAWTIGPLIGAFAFVVDDTIANLGGGDLGPLLAGALLALAIAARLLLPPLDGRRRRALVTPFILVSAGSFGTFLSGFGDLFDLRTMISQLQAGELGLGFGVFVLGMATAGVLIFYVMLIFAPRQVAEREGSPGTWAIRFLLFLVSLTLGATWLGLVRS